MSKSKIQQLVEAAPGILGVIGYTTTTTVGLPVAGVVAVAGLVGFGVFKGLEMASQKSESQ